MKTNKFFLLLVGASASLLPFLAPSQANATIVGCGGTSNSANFFDTADIPTTCSLLDGTQVSWGTAPTVDGTFQFQKTGSDYLLTFSPLTAISGPASGFYSYTITAATGFKVSAAQTNTTLGLGDSATTNTLTNVNMPAVTSTGGTQSLVGTLSPRLTAATFTSTYNVASGESLAQVADKFAVATYTPPSTVPGPLPLLGAGAAFGFSRRLRQRVKATA